MKRFHIHIGVEKLDESIRSYSRLFGAEPVKTKPDYAKWMLDDPRVNFAISTRAIKRGVNHLGIQVEEESELNELRSRLETADMTVLDEGTTTCCYARSHKSWVQDPTGIPWEAYRAMEDAQFFSSNASSSDSACCVPEAPEKLISLRLSENKAGCCDYCLPIR